MKKLSFKPRVLAVTGTMSSGKDSVARHFEEKYGFERITLSNYLRQEARKRGKHPSRKYLRKLQAELKKEYGNTYLLNKAIDTILKKDHMRMKNVIIVGVRAPEETKMIKDKLKAKLILVDADPFVRFQRAKERHRRGFAKNYEEFLQREAIENATFDFHKTKKLVDYKIDNNCTIKEMKRRIDKLAKKLGLKKTRKTRKTRK